TSTFAATTFANPGSSLAVNMGADSGTLTVSSMPDFTKALTLNGQAGTDNVVLQGANSIAGLNATVAGTITDAAGTSLAVTGRLALTAGVITLADNGTDTLTVSG